MNYCVEQIKDLLLILIVIEMCIISVWMVAKGLIEINAEITRFNQQRVEACIECAKIKGCWC